MSYSTQQPHLDRDPPLSVNDAASNITNNNSKAGQHATSLTYDTPSPQQQQQLSNTSSTTTSISSSDYALKVIFSQFEHMADAKMSIILNMGVVKCILSQPRRSQWMIVNESCYY